METNTGAPERRVLLGDAGAPLDTDRVLALALRWADRALTVEHVKVGQLARPLDAVEVKWEGSLPIFALADGTRAWVERESGRWVEAGRRVGLELGEVLLVETGQLTLEARVQKRSERLVASRGHENTFFGLVVAHALMLFAAVTTAMVITPHSDDESIWTGGGILRVVSAPFAQLPKRREPVIEDKINDALAKAPSFQQPQLSPIKKTANDVMKLLFGGGGGAGFVGGGPNDAIDSALNALGPGNGGGANGDGMGMGRDVGGGIGPGKGPGLGVGPLDVAKIPGGGFPTGLDKKPIKVETCVACALTPPGYDRELVLKIVKRHQNQIRFCYETELSKDPSLEGKVTVAWTIDGTGSVSVAQIAESGLKNDAVERCIVDRVRSWRFPEPAGGGEVAITFPWVFSTAGNE